MDEQFNIVEEPIESNDSIEPTEPETKKWYESKIIWTMIIQFLISFGAILQEFLAKEDYSAVAIIGLVSSALVIGLRVFFTDSPIAKSWF